MSDKMVVIKSHRNRSGKFKKKKYVWRSKPIIKSNFQRLAVAHSQEWNALDKLEKAIIKLGYPKRFFCLSLNEIGKLLDADKYVALRRLNKMIQYGYLIKQKNYLKLKSGRYTKIHARNYYRFTKKGKEEISRILRFLHQNTPQNNPPNGVKEQPRENRALAILNSCHNFPKYLKIFRKYGFSRLLLLLRDQKEWVINKILFELRSFSLKEIEKALKKVRTKVIKGFRLKSFWAFFRYMLKTGSKTFFRKKASDYLQALTKPNQINRGVSTNKVLEKLKKFKANGFVFSEQVLAKFMRFKTEKFLKALEVIDVNNKHQNAVAFRLCLRLGIIEGKYSSHEKISQENDVIENESRQNMPIWMKVKQSLGRNVVVPLCKKTLGGFKVLGLEKVCIKDDGIYRACNQEKAVLKKDYYFEWKRATSV